MIDYLDEINRILWAINRLGPDPANARTVIDICKQNTRRARLPDHEETIEFCKQLNLVIDSNGLSLTELGQELWSANTDVSYELTALQKSILIEKCFLTEPYKKDFAALLTHFKKDYETGSFVRSTIDSMPVTLDNQFVSAMLQVGLLSLDKRSIRINPLYARTLAEMISKTKSLEQLKQILEMQTETGAIAEEIIISFEKKRLKKLGCKKEAGLVRIVSALDVEAGYDLESFDGPTPSLQYDRFIEVKGSTRNYVRFFWSKNEMRIARRKRKQYWIYFQSNIDLTTKSSMNKPRMYQDPIISILQSASFNQEVQCLLIEESSR